MARIDEIEANMKGQDNEYGGLSSSAEFRKFIDEGNQRKLSKQQSEFYNQNAKDTKEALLISEEALRVSKESFMLSQESLQIAKESLKVSKKSHKATIIILIATLALILLTALLLI